MRKGDFSAKELQNYLGPNFGGGAYVNLDTVPTFAKDGTPIVNGQLPGARPRGHGADQRHAAFARTRRPAQTAITTPRKILWTATYRTVTGRLDDAIDENNHVFGRYTVENSTQGQPQVPYYSPSRVMGSVNTPGGGFLNDIRVHSAAANYVSIASTFTNELFGTLVYFTQKFDAKTPSALQSSAINYPYQGALNNGSKDFPQFQDYGYDGLPVAIQPDVSFGSPSLKKVQPNGGDNVTKVWGPHTVKIGVFAGRTTNNQTITNGETNGAIF